MKSQDKLFLADRTIGPLTLSLPKMKTKFLSVNFQKMLTPSYIILRIQRIESSQGRS